MSEALWFLGRGAGVVTLVLLTLTLALGIASRTGRPLPWLPRFVTPELHRTTSLLAVVLLAGHVGTLLFDAYAQLRLVDLVVPFAATYRPLWLGLGTLALDIGLALVVTSLLRPFLGAALWRRIHWVAYLAWPLAVLHALGAGTDAGADWMRALVAGCVAVTAVAAAARLAWSPPAEQVRSMP